MQPPMPVAEPVDASLLCSTLRASVEEIFTILGRELSELGYETVYRPGSYLVGVPKVIPPIALVAHLDTIHRHDKDALVRSLDWKTLWNKAGVLGADDRAGVFAIRKLLSYGHRPLVIFCDKEESGGIGANDLIDDRVLNQFLPELSMYLELDRANRDDYVWYSSKFPRELAPIVESLGWKPAHGSFSDVAVLSEETLVPHINASIGYYNQHTKYERLALDELFLNLARADNLLKLQNSIPKLRLDPEPRFTEMGFDLWLKGLRDEKNESLEWAVPCEVCDDYIWGDIDTDVDANEGDGRTLCLSCRYLEEAERNPDIPSMYRD